MNFHIERRISMSTPAVGSSRISSCGSLTIAPRDHQAPFHAADNVREIANALSHNASCFKYFSARSPATLRSTP
jgi:hypothetical protein